MLAIWVTQNSSTSKLESTLCLWGGGEAPCEHIAHEGLGNHRFPHFTSCRSEKIKIIDANRINVSSQNHTFPVDDLHN